MSNDAVKDELIKNVAELVAFMQSGMQSGVEFAQEQAPLLVQEMLMYGAVSTGLYIVWWTSVILFTLLNLRKWVNVASSDYDFKVESVYLIVGAVFSVIGVVSLVVLIPNALAIAFAPRLYILEQLKGLL